VDWGAPFGKRHQNKRPPDACVGVIHRAVQKERRLTKDGRENKTGYFIAAQTTRRTCRRHLIVPREGRRAAENKRYQDVAVQGRPPRRAERPGPTNVGKWWQIRRRAWLAPGGKELTSTKAQQRSVWGEKDFVGSSYYSEGAPLSRSSGRKKKNYGAHRVTTLPLTERIRIERELEPCLARWPGFGSTETDQGI